jgi:hypothetical protein
MKIGTVLRFEYGEEYAHYNEVYLIVSQEKDCKILLACIDCSDRTSIGKIYNYTKENLNYPHWVVICS